MKASEINKELARIRRLEAELLGQQGRMSAEEKMQALADAQPKVEFGSPEHASLLAAGYGMTIEQARTIIEERAKKPELWPYEEFAKAKAMIAAFEANPKDHGPSNTRQAWHRSSHG